MAKKKKKAARGTAKRGVEGRLTEAQRDWEKSEARSFGAPLPDGQYEGVIESALIEESRNGRLQVRWDLLVTSKECEGRQVRKYSGLETKDNMDWFKGDLETLGLKIPEESESIGDALEEAQGLAILFQVRSRDEFTNIDFIEPLEGGNGGDDSGSDDAPADASYTKKEIKAMGEDKMAKLAKEQGLDPNDYDTWEELADEIIDELGL